MNTDLEAHVGHRISLSEYVEMGWSTIWDGPFLRRKATLDMTVLDSPEAKLYCHTCDLWLTGFDADGI